jgi:hypothetical protein
LVIVTTLMLLGAVVHWLRGKQLLSKADGIKRVVSSLQMKDAREVFSTNP